MGIYLAGVFIMLGMLVSAKGYTGHIPFYMKCIIILGSWFSFGFMLEDYLNDISKK